MYYENLTLQVKHYSCKLWGLRVEWTSSSSGEKLGDVLELNDVTYTTKVSLSGSSVTAANSFLPTSSTRLGGFRKSFLSGINLQPGLPIHEINIRIVQGEKKHSKDYFRTNISHQEALFKEFHSIRLISHKLQLPFHRYLVWCRRYSVPWRRKAFQGAIGLTWRSSSLAKVGCLALTSLLESI